MAGINEGVQYLKSAPSVLKILEIILLLVSIGSVGYFWDNWFAKDIDDFPKHDYVKFFLAAAATAWIILLLFFLIFVAGIHKKIDAFNWAILAGVTFILLAILVFVASSLLGDSLRYYKLEKFCERWKIADLDSQCEQLTAGTVCGFFAGVILFVDGIIHFKL